MSGKDKEKKKRAAEAPTPPIATTSGEKITKEGTPPTTSTYATRQKKREATPPITSTYVRKPKKRQATPPVKTPAKKKEKVDVDAEGRKGDEAERKLLENTVEIQRNKHVHEYKEKDVSNPEQQAKNKFFSLVDIETVEEDVEKAGVDLRHGTVGDRTVTFRDKSGKDCMGPPTVEMLRTESGKKGVIIKVRFKVEENLQQRVGRSRRSDKKT